MTLIAPTLTKDRLVNDAHTRSKLSLLLHQEITEPYDAGKQLVVRTGGFSLNRLFSHRLPPLLQIVGRVENSVLTRRGTALALYLLVPAVISGIILVSVIYVLVFREENEILKARKTAKTAAAQLNINAVANSEQLFNQDILLHDNALFTSSSPPTPTLEEKTGPAAAAAKPENEIEEEISLSTPPRLPEARPADSNTPTTPAADVLDSPSPSSLESQFNATTTTTTITQDDGSTSPSTRFSLGPRASLKHPSAHFPSARAPTHKTQILNEMTFASDKRTIENDAYVHGEIRDVYNAIDNTGIWEAAPIRIEPTAATVLAVAGEEEADDALTENEVGGGIKPQKKAHWRVEDLKKELKATQEMVAALKGEISKRNER
jgi:hypothetical protein